MKTRLLPILLLLSAVSASLFHTPIAAQAGTPPYHIIKKIRLSGMGGWDYLIADSASSRLYISRSTHVTVLNTATGVVIGDIPDTNGVHGIAIDPKSGHGFTSNGRTGTVTIFSLKTLKRIADVPVGGKNPDCIILDPATERIFTFNGGSNDATAIDGATGKVIGRISLPGRPEFAVSGGNGYLYNNIEDKSEVVKINARTLKVERTWPIAPGDGPSGIAMNRKTHRVFSVCGNQKMIVLNADTGKVVAAPMIGNGPDACGFDPHLHYAISPNGEDGTLTVVQEVSPNKYHVVATIPTQTGARTMALDERTHHIFLMTATPAPTAAGAPQGEGGRWRRSYVPGSYVVLEYGP